MAYGISAMQTWSLPAVLSIAPATGPHHHDCAQSGSAARVPGSCGPVAWVLGSEPPAFSIGYEMPRGVWDSGFTVIYQDAPDPHELDGPDHEGSQFVCMRCLVDDDPAIGRGLDLAREYGVAELDENGEWVVGDVSRLDEGTV